ncbi:DNA-binding response regulator [Paenibacillus herberti]|uniref:DNA-binding response regulator n=2 Tax=Paenibacillus herberti TaxID=1619309 RepID=A0A229NYF6_9BACL|nr:DNA-binding response regulator [Paenibacillus herberti]
MDEKEPAAARTTLWPGETSSQLVQELLREDTDPRRLQNQLEQANLGWLSGEYTLGIIRGMGSVNRASHSSTISAAGAAAGVRLGSSQGAFTAGAELDRSQGAVTAGMKLGRSQGVVSAGVELGRSQGEVTAGVELGRCQGAVNDVGEKLGLSQGAGRPNEEGGEFSAMQRRLKQLLESESDWVLHEGRDGNIVLLAREEVQLRRLAEHLEGHTLLGCRLSLSSRSQGIGQLRRAYSQARQVQKYFLLHPGSSLLAYDSLRSLSSGCQLPIEAIRRLSNLLGTGRLAEMKRQLQYILDIRLISRCEIGYLEGISRRLNEEVFDSVFRSYGEESIDILKLYKSAGHIENFERFEDYYGHVEQLLERLDAFVSTVRGTHTERKDLQKAVDYLQKHYAEDVNMAVVSNHISLNYTYFSQAFKEHTGESFSSYLRKLRLNRAKELLAESELKVYEISSQAGFDNVKHFTRVFKETEGVTPLEYRSLKQGSGAGR